MYVISLYINDMKGNWLPMDESLKSARAMIKSPLLYCASCRIEVSRCEKTKFFWISWNNMKCGGEVAFKVKSCLDYTVYGNMRKRKRPNSLAYSKLIANTDRRQKGSLPWLANQCKRLLTVKFLAGKRSCMCLVPSISTSTIGWYLDRPDRGG